MPGNQDLRALQGTHHLPSRARAQQQLLLQLSCSHLLRVLTSRKQCGHSLSLHALPASETLLAWIHGRHCIMYCCLSKGTLPAQRLPGRHVCDLSKQFCCSNVSSGQDLCNASWQQRVSEIRCHSCQSSIIHLSHKAIECDSKRSPSAKPILKNYLKANC